jgi:hypothetical protein
VPIGWSFGQSSFRGLRSLDGSADLTAHEFRRGFVGLFAEQWIGAKVAQYNLVSGTRSVKGHMLLGVEVIGIERLHMRQQ